MFRSVGYNSKYLYWITIPGLIIFNILQKILFLDSEPFWYDEIVSIKAALLDFGHIKHMSEWDNNPPFYYYSLWVWLKLVGVSEFKARFLSVLFSAISACVIFIIAKKHFNYKTAVGAALLFSFHNFVYTYTYEARAYSLVVLLVLLSSYLFLELLRAKNIKTILLLGLVNFLVIYTHYIAGLVLVFQFFILLIYKREFIKPYLISSAILIVLVIIRFTKKQFVLILSYEKGAETFWLKTADKDSLNTALVNLFSGTYAWIFFFILFIAAVASFIHLRKAIEKNTFINLSYLALSGGGSILLLFLVGIFKPIFLDRYLLFAVPFICIIITWFLFNSNRFLQFLIIPLTCLQLWGLNPDPKKSMDFRMAADVVTELRTNNEFILLQTKDITGLFAYYYSKDLFMDQKNLGQNLDKNRIFEIENVNDLNSLKFKDENTIIFCQTFEKAGDNTQIFDIFKQNNFVFSSTKAVKGVKISLLKKIKHL